MDETNFFPVLNELARKFPNSLGRGLVNPAPIPAAQG